MHLVKCYYLNYFPIYPPLSLRHFLILSGIPLIKLSRISGEMRDHANFTWFSSILILVATSISFTLFWTIAHKFLFWFRSGEFPGQIPFSQNEQRLFLHHSCVFIAWWAGAPSCWKMYPDMFGSILLARTDPVFRFLLREHFRHLLSISST